MNLAIDQTWELLHLLHLIKMFLPKFNYDRHYLNNVMMLSYSPIGLQR